MKKQSYGSLVYLGCSEKKALKSQVPFLAISWKKEEEKKKKKTMNLSTLFRISKDDNCAVGVVA